MALVTMSGMLKAARAGRYAVAAFDVSDGRMMRAAIETAESLHSPVILMALAVDIEGASLAHYMDAARPAAERASVPVAIHLDHATDIALCQRALDAGFTSVMYDGSILPFQQNADNTAAVVRLAQRYGASTEAELGHVTDGLVGGSETGWQESAHDDPQTHLTVVSEAADFVRHTGVDSLAVAIGTAHGVYVKTPVLDFDRLSAIASASPVPLVLHGGSGTPDADIQRAVSLGICKINIFSEVLLAFNAAMKETVTAMTSLNAWPSVLYRAPDAAMRNVMSGKIRLFGGEGRA